MAVTLPTYPTPSTTPNTPSFSAATSLPPHTPFPHNPPFAPSKFSPTSTTLFNPTTSTPTQIRCVATAAVLKAHNRNHFVHCVTNNIRMQVDVLSGEEEARLGFLGVLQFLPIHDKLTLTVDIGGGSTEFAIGKEGKSVFGTSLKLGHVALTQSFQNKDAVPRMREHIRSVINESGLVGRIKEHGFEVAVGSSGTIRAIDKAVFRGYSRGGGSVNKAVLVNGGRRGWSFTRGD